MRKISCQPEYRRDENWLKIVKWDQLPLKTVAKKELTCVWAETIRNGRRHAVRSVQNADEVILEEKYFDLERGGEFVGHTWFDQQGRRYSQSALKLSQLASGVWFPVLLEESAFDPDSGEISARIRYVMNERNSRFGHKADVDQRVFDELPKPSPQPN